MGLPGLAFLFRRGFNGITNLTMFNYCLGTEACSKIASRFYVTVQLIFTQFYSTYVKTTLSLPDFHYKFVSLDKEVPQTRVRHFNIPQLVEGKQVFAFFSHFTSMHTQLHVNRISNRCLKWLKWRTMIHLSTRETSYTPITQGENLLKGRDDLVHFKKRRI